MHILGAFLGGLVLFAVGLRLLTPNAPSSLTTATPGASVPGGFDLLSSSLLWNAFLVILFLMMALLLFAGAKWAFSKIGVTTPTVSISVNQVIRVAGLVFLAWVAYRAGLLEKFDPSAIAIMLAVVGAIFIFISAVRIEGGVMLGFAVWLALSTPGGLQFPGLGSSVQTVTKPTFSHCDGKQHTYTLGDRDSLINGGANCKLVAWGRDAEVTLSGAGESKNFPAGAGGDFSFRATTWRCTRASNCNVAAVFVQQVAAR